MYIYVLLIGLGNDILCSERSSHSIRLSFYIHGAVKQFVLMIPANFIDIVKDAAAGFYGFLLVCICTVRLRSFAIHWNT